MFSDLKATVNTTGNLLISLLKNTKNQRSNVSA